MTFWIKQERRQGLSTAKLLTFCLEASGSLAVFGWGIDSTKFMQIWANFLVEGFLCASWVSEFQRSTDFFLTL